jgi:hypothetical protein
VNKNVVQYGLPLFIFLIIFFPLFYTNYVYLDDSHLLLYNEKGANFKIWTIHGRLLSGLFFEKIYTSINSINGVIILRIISVLGWMLGIGLFVTCVRQWVRQNNLDNRLVVLSGVYLACSLSLGIYNGWGGSCAEVFMAFSLGLLSGHLFYMQLKKRERYIKVPLPMQLLVLVLGVGSLFFYQIGLGAFLLPFFLHFITKKFEKPDRILIAGVIGYLVITLVYYLLFKLNLRLLGEAEPARAGLNFDLFGKISFFFGVPTAQAFSFNFLFNLRSIISQAFYIVALVVWVVYVFISNRNQRVTKKLLYIAVVFLLQMLIYLPVLVSLENFSSYRTMINLNLATFFLLVIMILEWLKKDVSKTRFVIAAMLVFAATGFYNFRVNFLNPIVKEYQVLRNYVEQHYTAGINKIYFLRPPENLFYKQYGIHIYRDEFGEPSTYKDWVPEPLVKQIIFENTHNKQLAKSIQVVQFAGEEKETFNKQVALKEDHTMAIDMEVLFNEGSKKQ